MKLGKKLQKKRCELWKRKDTKKHRESFDSKYRRQPMLDLLFDTRVDKEVAEEARKDPQYLRKEREVEQKVRKIDHAGLTHKQWHIVDDALSVHNSHDILYAKAAYSLGFKDGVQLIREIFTDCEI